MPRIIVVSESTSEREGTITLDERVAPSRLRDENNSVELIQRVGWAVHEADVAEPGDAGVTDGPDPSGRSARENSNPAGPAASGGDGNERLHDVAQAVRDHEGTTRDAVSPARAADERLYRRLRRAFHR